MNKHKVGEILYWLPFVALTVLLIVVLSAKELPSKKVVGWVFSSAFLISTLSALLTEEVGVRGYGPVKKKDRPKIYWFQIIFFTFIGILFLLTAFTEK